MILSHSFDPSVRILASQEFLRKNSKVFCIADDVREFKYWLQYSEFLTGKECQSVDHIPGLLHALHARDGTYLIPASILTFPDSVQYLETIYCITLERGSAVSPDVLIDALLARGYRYAPHGAPGSYRREGDIIHIFDPLSSGEIVIEYFDTEIDTILFFSEGERNFLDQVIIYAVTQDEDKELTNNKKHTILESGLHEAHIKLETLINLKLLPLISQTPIILIGCDSLHERYTDGTWRDILAFPTFPLPSAIDFDIKPLHIRGISELIDFLQKTLGEIVVITKYEHALEMLLHDNHISRDTIRVFHGRALCASWQGSLPHGISYTFLGDDIFSRLFVRYRAKRVRAKDLDLLLSIKPGDFVVHRDHGVGQFLETLTKRVGSTEREYMEILYAENDRLFLPLTELGRITKYVGAETPVLTPLTGKEWERTMKKTDDEVALIAAELLEVSAKRVLSRGFSFPAFPEEEQRFQDAFPFDYTLDQKQAILEILSDMEKDSPMDRLLAGDVGFGKTEVAMNAVYRAVLSGAQVAVVSPLLVLAEEHYETFVERMEPFGVKVALLTRIQKPREEKTILHALRQGEIDVLIGTHRLLSEDIHFRRLGLLIIDEEHKFGVEHKERFKKLKSHLDVLMLSATPIPRSLNLALSGLKTISLLTTAPYMRKSIRTIITVWNESVIRSAIVYELRRGGQVLILHNRVRTLDFMKSAVEEILTSSDIHPRIITTHGRLAPEEIEDRIHAFKKQEYDILISTTIIENGVNFLHANTIIITDPQDFGLAQLHQLRGRVGRKDVEGFCYLLYREHELTIEARDRMVTLANHSELGAGYEIAMRDMEIRGVGDVLGFRQAGKSKDVGISLYFQLLEEKVESIKTGKTHEEFALKIELDISTALPLDFFDSDIDKLSFYRDVEAITTLEDLQSVEETFLGQSTIVPGEYSGLENLFLILRAKLIFSQYGVMRIATNGDNVIFDFLSHTDPERVRAFLERFDKKKRMILLSPIKIRMERKWWENSGDMLREIVNE